MTERGVQFNRLQCFRRAVLRPQSSAHCHAQLTRIRQCPHSCISYTLNFLELSNILATFSITLVFVVIWKKRRISLSVLPRNFSAVTPVLQPFPSSPTSLSASSFSGNTSVLTWCRNLGVWAWVQYPKVGWHAHWTCSTGSGLCVEARALVSSTLLSLGNSHIKRWGT